MHCDLIVISYVVMMKLVHHNCQDLNALGSLSKDDLKSQYVRDTLEKYGIEIPTSFELDDQNAGGPVPVDFGELPSQEDGPERVPQYNPKYGYEPYWPQGSWVFETKATDITGEPEIDCGEKCNEIYKEYGIICARTPLFQYKTFYNFCEMRSEDCNDLHQWRALHRGACGNATVFYRDNVVSNISPFINKFLEIYGYTERFIGYPSRPSWPTTISLT